MGGPEPLTEQQLVVEVPAHGEREITITLAELDIQPSGDEMMMETFMITISGTDGSMMAIVPEAALSGMQV